MSIFALSFYLCQDSSLSCEQALQNCNTSSDVKLDAEHFEPSHRVGLFHGTRLLNLSENPKLFRLKAFSKCVASALHPEVQINQPRADDKDVIMRNIFRPFGLKGNSVFANMRELHLK